MWHFDVSERHCHEEFTPLYTTQWDPWASSVWRRRATLKPISRCCARCASLYPSHSNLLLLFSSRLRGTISLHSFYPLLRRWITATIIPHALKWHPNTKLADTLTSTSTPPPHRTPSSFLGNELQFQIRLSHQFLLVKGKKREEKQWKWWFLSPGVWACRMQSTLTFHLISFSI